MLNESVTPSFHKHRSSQPQHIALFTAVARDMTRVGLFLHLKSSATQPIRIQQSNNILFAIILPDYHIKPIGHTHQKPWNSQPSPSLSISSASLRSCATASTRRYVFRTARPLETPSQLTPFGLQVYPDDALSEITISEVGLYIPDPTLIQTCSQIYTEALGYLKTAQQKLRSRQYYLAVNAEEIPSPGGANPITRLDKLANNLDKLPRLSTFQFRIEGLKSCPSDRALIFQIQAAPYVQIFLAAHAKQVDVSLIDANYYKLIAVEQFLSKFRYESCDAGIEIHWTRLDFEGVVRLLQSVLNKSGCSFLRLWR
jgi:hypothetical protein